MSAVQTATGPSRWPAIDGRESSSGIRKLIETLPMVITVACQPVESAASATASRTP